MKLMTVTLIGSLLLSGCSMLDLQPQRNVKVKVTETTKGLEIASFPAELRGAYVYTGADGVKVVCAEPFTDVAASNSLNATASAVNNLSNSLNRSLEGSRNNNTSLGNNRSSTNESTSGEEISSNSGNNNEKTSSRGSENTIKNTFGSTSQADQNINLGLNAVTEIVALEGRTQFVLLAREMLFRTCEAAANGKLDSVDSPVAKQHEHIFTALSAMIETQKVKAEVKKAEAKVEEAKIVLKTVEKLDEKILKVFPKGNINDTILKIFMDQYDACITDAANDNAKKTSCRKTYNDQITKLAGN